MHSDVFFSFLPNVNVRNASVKRDNLAAKRQIQEDSNDSGITNKYLKVALLADEQIVAYHGDRIDEFLLLIGSIVSIKTLYILWTVNNINIGSLGARGFSRSVSGVGYVSIASLLVSATFGRRNKVKCYRSPRPGKKTLVPWVNHRKLMRKYPVDTFLSRDRWESQNHL